MIKDRRSAEYIRGIVNAAMTMAEVTPRHPAEVNINFTLEKTEVKLTYRSGYTEVVNDRHGRNYDSVGQTQYTDYVVDFKSTIPVKDIVIMIQDAMEEIYSLEYKE